MEDQIKFTKEQLQIGISNYNFENQLGTIQNFY